MAPVTFHDWWQIGDNQNNFWRQSKPKSKSEKGVAVSLGETPRSIFRQILQLLKGYHDQNIGYGNLLEGVRIDENKQVALEPNPNIPLEEPFAAIKQDMLDFKKLFNWVEALIYQEKGVRRAYSSTKFHQLYRLLDNDNHYRTVDELRRFGFFMRNNPLFLDDTAKFLFFRKVLTLKEFNVRDFHISVKLSLQDWSDGVRNEDLLAVKNYNGGNPTSQSGDPTSQGCNPTNQSKYKYPDESIVFFRNCLGHMRSRKGGVLYHDAKILHALEDDLPKVIPVWFYDLVRELDSNKSKCTGMCGHSWMEFLSMQPSVFT